MKIVIREAVEKDVEIIYKLILELSRHENTQKYILTNTEILREQGFGQDKKFGTLLAEYDGNTAGYLTYVWNYSTWQGGYYMYLENIFVLEPYRRFGVGSALMQKARTVCENNGRLHMKWEVQPENEKAIRFYKKQGATVSLRGIGSCKVK
jgi:GNAT superfamily N-acetyltransferase